MLAELKDAWAGRERLNLKGVFLALDVKEQPMIQAIVVTVAAVLCIALTRRGQPNAPGLRKSYASCDSFDKLDMSAANLKAAVKKVDRSAAAVEVALKGLMAARDKYPCQVAFG
jgi:hypothetical protein